MNWKDWLTAMPFKPLLMLVYRIVFKAWSHTLFAPGVAGRWNGTGRKVIYTAASIPLAFLENMIQRKGVGFNDDFKIIKMMMWQPTNCLCSLRALTE
jgi:RES domain-containing protein